MSMILVMYTLGDANIQRVLDDPPLIWKIVSPDDPRPYEREKRGPAGLISRLFGRKPKPLPAQPNLELGEGEVVESDLDKAWHGIHYLLTGTAWEGEPPLNLLVSGGTEVGDIDVGYGPPRVLTSGEVRAAHEALREIDEATLRTRFEPAEMMRLEIYPEIWDRNPAEDDTFGYCAGYFATLKSFVSDAAERGSGMVICLT